MGTFILPLDTAGTGRRVAVKDLIDLAGTPTTAGCRVLAASARPAEADAACLVGIRAAEAAGEVRIVGKTGLNELAYGVTGLNPWYSSPVNPIDPARVVGGSSSGSAAAVGHGEADVAVGSDTGGSIRIPAACCGVAGLKTTAGRIPLDGVWPLAPTLDTIGPMATTVAGLVEGMTLLEPGFRVVVPPVERVGRVRLPATDAIDFALDRALHVAELATVEVFLPGWDAATSAGMTVLAAEAWASDAALASTGGLSPEVAVRLWSGADVDPAEVASARRVADAWRSAVVRAMAPPGAGAARLEVLVMPTLSDVAPLVAQAARVTGLRLTMPWNLAGWPALALPVPVSGGGVPASLQLVARPGREDLLLATAGTIEAAIG